MDQQEPRSIDSERNRLETLAAANATRGRALFYLDRASALASDHVRATFPDLVASRIVDWIVDTGAHGHEFLFVAKGDPPRVVCRVTFDVDGNPIGERLDEAATPRQLAILNAKRIASTTGTVPRDIGYNVIVVPPPRNPPAEPPIEIYLLRTAPAPGDVVIGIHWYVLVSSDGARVLDTKPLSRSDLTLAGSNGTPPEAISVTHFLDEVPSEIHTYLSFKHDRPIEVITIPSNASWLVRGEEIKFLRFLDR